VPPLSSSPSTPRYPPLSLSTTTCSDASLSSCHCLALTRRGGGAIVPPLAREVQERNIRRAPGPQHIRTRESEGRVKNFMRGTCRIYMSWLHCQWLIWFDHSFRGP
jgi:hypothetical protein